MITSPAGVAIAEQLRQIFEALKELDKHAPQDVTDICAVMSSHLRAFRPQAIVAAQLAEVKRGR